MDWTAKVGLNIRRLRAERLLTQEQLAGEADIAMRHLGRIERGEASPTVDMVAKLARALGVSPRDLFGESETRSPEPPENAP
ncbi:helix-turn-helix transcriptional regulator [Sphingobium sp. DEHP117]|uniref:helix-turn-helix domain-containing protein n=1 Tax=Sphingobium sp. DEHP117 TaxID=2993436 RepID=UPI0027D6DD69|nr:helix-turn-helix domain-containing protein [Sphingobium sp. DEHP117]MDQ4420940.1 helix-turn-helix transcriptional regulator [Sphingobium sp. DEHP117]